MTRGNIREPIFHKEEDFAAFERVIGQGLERGCHFGNEAWVEKTVKRLGLESTQRSRGRLRKLA